MDERLLQMYNLELGHLRETAAEFGREFPKIAGRLALGRDGKEVCDDPYVERLLEGFAFLAARVHLKMDAEYPRFTQGLLETVYPDYLCPVPSMAIVRLEPELNEPALAAGPTIKRGALLRSQPGKGERTSCTFTTAQDVRLLPLDVAEAAYVTREFGALDLPSHVIGKAAFRIKLRKTASLPLKDIRLSPLTFHIRGVDDLPGQIYEQLFAHRHTLVVREGGPGRKILAVLPRESIRRVGFSGSQALLPPNPRGFEGYRLLREYFAFPERFLFFEFGGFDGALAQADGDEVELIAILDEQDARLEGRVDKSSFSLFCTPAVNLFEKTLDRITLSNAFSEFHVVPDRNRPLDFEVYQINSVTGHGDKPEDEVRYMPFYQAKDIDAQNDAFFTVNRIPRLATDRERMARKALSDYAGTDVFISIVDGDMAPHRPDVKQLQIRALCTNRHLPIQMATGLGQTDFNMEISAPVRSIRMVQQRPTPPKASLVLAGQNTEESRASSGRFAWRLISHLSLNYLSLIDSGKTQGAEALRELLKLYADPNDRDARKQIDGVRGVSHRPALRRVEVPGPITFARGLEVTVNLDESAFEGRGVFILGSVLEQFFQKYVSLNSFVETVITTQQRKEIMRWPPQMGRREIL
jgi:type VI secretion system protein ImpG